VFPATGKPLTFDQRGFGFARVDIGAFEKYAAVPVRVAGAGVPGRGG